MRRFVIIALWCLMTVAPASALGQLRVPDGQSSFLERARAVWPTGRSAHRVAWDAQLFEESDLLGAPTRSSGQQLNTHSFDVIFSLDSVTLEVNMTGLVQWVTPDLRDQAVTIVTGNPEVGALFSDSPIPELRYQLGAAIALPLETTTVADGVSSSSWFPLLYHLLRTRSLGWNAHRLLPETFTAIARGRLEVDPHPNLVLGLHVDVPLTITFAGAVDVRPQAALTIAARIDDLTLLGVRTEIVANLPSGDYTRDATVMVEPFARIAWSIGAAHFDFYTRLALRVPLGPAFTFVTARPIGWIGGSVEIGALY